MPGTFLNSGRLTEKHYYECISVINLKVLHGLWIAPIKITILLNTGLYPNWHFLCHTFIILCVRWWGGGREFDPKCNLSIVISTKLSWRIQDTTDND